MSTLPVIAAVDGSDDSLRALEWALDEARLRGTALRLVHVREYPPLTEPEVLAVGPPEVPDDPVLSQVRTRLATREGLPPLEYVDMEGVPSAVLPELGASGQLLVLGSRGRGGFASLLLGSNGLAAARDAECPVVVVPSQGRPAQSEEPAAQGPRVVVGASARTPDANTLAFAFDAADRRGARLGVVCASPWPAYVWTVAGEFTPTADDERATQDQSVALVNEALAPYRSDHPDVDVEVRVAPGDAASHLVAASKDADLVVVGRHRRRPLSPLRMLGTVTHAVLLHAASPVAVVPPEMAANAEGRDDTDKR